MHRNTQYSASSSGHPPPPPQARRHSGYDRYNNYPPPPPPYTQLPPTPSQQWDRRDSRDSRHGNHNSGNQSRGSYSDLRQSRDSHHNYQPPRGEFTFRQEAPPGINPYTPSAPLQYDSRHSNARPHDTHYGRHGDRNSRSSYATRRDESRRTRGGQYSHQSRGQSLNERGKAAHRPLLSTRFNDQPELMLGNTAVRATYKDVDELSDSDEVDMDISDNGDSDSNEPERPAKRVRTTDSEKATIASLPKWSNPDPYTALPPPETTRKKDVVQLIRKARVQAETKQNSIPTEAAEFISCDFTDDESPNQPRNLSSTNIRLENVQTTQPATRPLTIQTPQTPNKPEVTRPTHSTHATPSTLSRSAPSTLPPKPPMPARAHDGSRSATNQQSSNQQPSPVVALAPSSALGSRKRTFDDQIKSAYTPLKRTNKMASAGVIVPIWEPKQGENPCPWVVNDHSKTPNAGTRLHKEIRDFYEYVRPRDFEERQRGELIARLEGLVRLKWHDAQVLPFGSFMSGLYLPTADMDIAICSTSFINGRYPVYDRRKCLYDMKRHLGIHGVAANDEIETITKAKVPLLKYVDEYTGLKVDISFEKMDGYKAIDTFLMWKNQYPSMPPLVAIIKHFLLMRALNEPVNGGIGGFTVICMVVHVLQMMPQVQSRSMKTDHHLGDLLMEFLDYYGNRFNYETVAIRMNPPGVVNKAAPTTVVYRNTDRLSIIDPNNSENDISGGSSNFWVIRNRFAQAYQELHTAMLRAAKPTNPNTPGDLTNTLLYTLLAGNYSHFRLQRDWLYKMANKSLTGTAASGTGNK
ncbi:hypothetical protein GGR50DRAFT_229502 [Xylaria sp. CBS 124048]|nr:hypothetical protein GGR50DRAFT_229502 [Xylaria sp. CBS 124048]